MQITRSSIATMIPSTDWFTGSVFVDTFAVPSEGSRVSGHNVHFAPGARSAWHTHPNGQTLFITEVDGWTSQLADLASGSGDWHMNYPARRAYVHVSPDARVLEIDSAEA